MKVKLSEVISKQQQKFFVVLRFKIYILVSLCLCLESLHVCVLGFLFLLKRYTWPRGTVLYTSTFTHHDFGQHDSTYLEGSSITPGTTVNFPLHHTNVHFHSSLSASMDF